MTGDAAHGALARQDQPVFFFVMVVEAKADPEAGDAVDFGGDPRVRPEAGGQFALDQVVEARIRHRFDTVVGFRRQQPDALAGRQFVEQFRTLFRGGGEKCRPDQVDRGSGKLCCFTGPRLGLDVAENAQPGGGGENDEGCQQQEGARQQRARNHCRSAPSGTKT